MRRMSFAALLALVAVMATGCQSIGRAPEATVQRLDGDVKLPAVFGPNMVLQRNKPITIWGTADPGQEVRIWIANRGGKAVADESGKWRLQLKPLRAGGPHRMIVSGKQTYALDNVMVGEVWLSSGQSNMEWPVAQSDRAQEEIAAANHPNIRFFKVPRRPASVPMDDVDAAWVTCSPQTAQTFSAVAYFFGRELHNELNVPIGLIDSSWGGTMVEPWTPREAFVENEAAMKYVAGKLVENQPLQGHPTEPTVLYNGMIAPLAPYAIRGAVWYQGESNVPRAYQYETLFSTMIEGWRDAWTRKAGAGREMLAKNNKRDAFSFYFVQLAPFNYNHNPAAMAELREGQLGTLRKTPNTGMVVTTDIGNVSDIHPTNKQEVGRRLALWALAKDYGRSKLVHSGPLYRSMTVEGDKIRIHFDHVGGGLVAKDGPLTWWQIAGEDKNFVEAQAVIEGNTVVVHANDVARPVAVRFGWHHSAEPNLFNAEGLPASPFRTDDWPRVTEAN